MLIGHLMEIISYNGEREPVLSDVEGKEENVDDQYDDLDTVHCVYLASIHYIVSIHVSTANWIRQRSLQNIVVIPLNQGLDVPFTQIMVQLLNSKCFNYP